MAFGDPIYIDRKNKLTDEDQAALEAQLQSQFDALDAQINPDFKYDPSK